MTFSMVFSLLALITISLPIMHYLLRYNVVLIGLTFLLEIFSTISGFLGCLVFGIKHDVRSWLMNPRFNHLDWSYYIALLSILLNFLAAILFAFECRRARSRRQRFTNLIYNMHPRSPGNGFETVPLKNLPSPGTSSPLSAQHYQQNRFNKQSPRSPDSIHSSPYASISRFSQGQQQGYPIKSSPRHFTAV
ncbi:Claudin-like protein [Sarcoptes scabiei]|nr:Claudin-like protein [Sarcoptes scabiei]